MIKCSFCGHVYEEEDSRKGCSGCPVNRFCKKTKCPNCGFEMAKGPALIKVLKKGKDIPAMETPTVNPEGTKVKKLAELKRGQEGIVVGFDMENEAILKKLMSIGVMPGMSIKAIQTFPSHVFQVGYTQVAVDKTIASAILVDV